VEVALFPTPDEEALATTVSTSVFHS